MSRSEMEDGKTSMAPKDSLSGCWVRWSLLAFGWLNVGLGIVGVVVPGLPTTIFLIIALWAFSKSSEKFQKWLWNHPRFGPSLRAWHQHRVIPYRAKVMAVVMMSSSFLFITIFVAETVVLPLVMAAILVPVSAYVLSRQSTIPENSVRGGGETT
jgi:hypothetical protein